MKIEGYQINFNRAQFDEKRLKEACTEFEAIFISKLLDGLRKTVDKSSLFESKGSEIFEDMLYDEYARKMAQTGAFGIGKMIYEDIYQKFGVRS